MPNSGPSDSELLADWLGRDSETAFHTLVSRYAGLVLMTARRTCGDDSLAAEASQLTFILLARKAKSLTNCASLGGWMHRAALMHAKNLLRTSRRECRKRQHLQTAMEHSTHDQAGEIWLQMQPVLDEALAALSDKDREALLMRFYRSLSVREIAGTLGIATEAAQKRIERATERLRRHLARRGCQTGGTLAAVMLAGFAADTQAAAPVVSLFTSKALAAGTAGAGVIATTTILLTAAAMKATSIIIPSVAILATAWVAVQHHSISNLEQQNTRLQKDLSSSKAAPLSPGRSQVAGGGARAKAADSRGGDPSEEAWQSLVPGPQRAEAVTVKARGILYEKNPARRLKMFSEFIDRFQPGDFDAIAASFAEHDQQGRLFPQEYDLFLSMAATVDGQAAMANIFKDREALDRHPFGAQHSAMTAWAVEDPGKAVEWWNNLPDSVVKEELARSLISGAASKDLDFAWRCVAEFPEAERSQFMGSLVQQRVTDQGAESASQWLDSLQSADGSDLAPLKQEGFRTLFGTLMNLSPAKKSEFINQFIDEPWMQRSEFAMSVASQWATQNGNEAVAWADSLPAEARLNAVMSALGMWKQKNSGEYDTWRAVHESDPVFVEPIRLVDEFSRAKSAEQP